MKSSEITNGNTNLNDDDDEYFEDLLKNGRVEVEPVYYSINNGQTSSSSTSSTSSSSANANNNNSNSNSTGNKIKRGKAYRLIENNEYVCFVGYDGIFIKPGDGVYVDSQRLDQPYFIAGVQGFKMTKRDQFNVLVKWYYRPCEVPETVYRTLVQDRHSEHASSTTNYLKDPVIQSRELFISDAIDTYPISSIKGKCIVHHLKDIGTTARETTKKITNIDDSFFYILGYNPENNRLASIQGEIRIGPSHQPRLPDFRPSTSSDVAGGGVGADSDDERVRETLIWTPGRIADSDIMMYLRAARSMAVFAGMCDGGSTEDGCSAAARDQTTLNALNSLHSNNYDTGRALQELVRNPVPLSVDKKWTEEETKKFVRGLKLYGKNFFKIRNELLPQKQTCELIEFYYLWKKTAAASSQRPRQRQRRPQTTTILRRVKPAPSGKPSRPASNEFLDLSSASENECDSDEFDAKDLTGYACHHCYTTNSKNWHHAGKDRALLCADCRLHFKKYGELRVVDRPKSPPPFLFTPVKENSSDANNVYHQSSSGGVKTRRSVKSSSSGDKNRRKPSLTPTGDMEKLCRTNATVSPSAEKSPGETSSGSSTSGIDLDKKSPKPKGSSSKKRKQIDKEEYDGSTTPVKQICSSVGGDNSSTKKKPRVRPNPSETCSVGSGGESSSGGNEGDTEMVDNSSSPSAPSSPSTEHTSSTCVKSLFNPSAVEGESNSAKIKSKPIESMPTTTIKNETIEDSSIAKIAQAAHYETPTTSSASSDLPKMKLERNVYSFQEEESFNLQSLEQYRRNVQHAPNVASTSSVIPAAAVALATQVQNFVDYSNPTSIYGPIYQPMFAPPPMMSIINQPFSQPQPPAPAVISCATSVIKENLKIKDEPGMKIKDEPVDETATTSGDEENQYDRSLPGLKEPEPKIDDTECHRSESAIFRRHWYRGESNSCARTDLVFIPTPDSYLARRRKAASKEQEQKKDKPISMSRPTTNSSQIALPSPHGHSSSAPSPSRSTAARPPSGFQTPSTPYPSQPPSMYPPSMTPMGGGANPSQDLPFLARLKEYATAAAQATPGTAAFYQAAMMDPVLQSRILNGVYGPIEKERLEHELRERQQEMLQRDFDLASKMMCSSTPGPSSSATPSGLPPNVDPRQWIGLPPGVGSFSPAISTAAAVAMGLIPPNGPMLPPGACFALPPGLDPATADRILATLSAERLQLERLMVTNPNPWLRMEFERISAQLAAFAGTQHHTHSHTHSHTHLHIHPSTGNPITGQDAVSSVSSMAPTNHPLWTPMGAHPGAMNPEALLLQYAMMRPAGFVDGAGLVGGFPQFPGVPPPGFGLPPQTGLDPLGAERLHQLQQQELHRRMMIERDQMISNQQQIVQHNEMMRRLQQEGGLVSLMGGQHPMSALTGAGVLRPSPSPFEKR